MLIKWKTNICWLQKQLHPWSNTFWMQLQLQVFWVLSLTALHIWILIFSHSSWQSCSSSVRLDRDHWWTTIFMSCHRLSVGLKSVLWLDHFNTFSFLDLNTPMLQCRCASMLLPPPCFSVVTLYSMVLWAKSKKAKNSGHIRTKNPSSTCLLNHDFLANCKYQFFFMIFFSFLSIILVQLWFSKKDLLSSNSVAL